LTPGLQSSPHWGSTLANSFRRPGLIDEYRPIVHPVVLGRGIPYFPPLKTAIDLQLPALVGDILSPTLKRGADDLGQRFLIGGRECAEKLASDQAVGAQEPFLWPVQDELRQLEIFSERVVPLVSGTGVHP